MQRYIINFQQLFVMFFQEEDQQQKAVKPNGSKFMKGIKSKTSEAYSFPSPFTAIINDNKFRLSKKETNQTEIDFCSTDNGFISSIINKIKSVKRAQPTIDSNILSNLRRKLRRPLQKKFGNIMSPKQVQKKLPQLLDVAKIEETAEQNLTSTIFKSEEMNFNVQEQLTILKQENLNLKNTIAEMNEQIQLNKRKCEELGRQIQLKDHLIAKIEMEIEQREVTHADQLEQQCSKIEDLTSLNKQLKTLVQNLRSQQSRRTLKFVKVLEHKLFPCDNPLLIKANQQVLSLKTKIIKIQKQSVENMKQLQKRNYQQIEQMRKNFNKSFNQYKATIGRISIKDNQQVKTRRLQPIVEAGSIYQS